MARLLRAAALIDLNADVGEGGVEDDALLAVITSASIACGGHAGDALTMRRTCAGALAQGVAIGAHVSYDDRQGFGRRDQDPAPALLRRRVREQIAVLGEQAAAVGATVAYVKPHGALYNRCLRDARQAAAVVGGIVDGGGRLPLLGPPGSALLTAAREAGLGAVPEGFADRTYQPGGGLAPRSQPGAVLGREGAVEQALELALRRSVDAAGLRLEVRSLCVHGDSPGAAAIAAAVRQALERTGVELRAFV